MSTETAIDYALRCASRLVSAVFDLSTDDFTGPRKGPPTEVHARQVLCYLLHTEGGFDQVVIASALNRHRSTVGHAIGVVSGLRETDEIDRAIGKLGEMYRELRDAHEKIPALVEALAP